MLAASNVQSLPNKVVEHSTPPFDLTSFNELHLPIRQFTSSKAWLRGLRKNMAIAGAAFALFMAAFHEWPAGTLPNDEDFLVEKSGLSDEVWTALRDDVLLDWTLVDGRLRFPLATQVAEKALAAKRRASEKAGKAADARWQKAKGVAAPAQLHVDEDASAS